MPTLASKFRPIAVVVAALAAACLTSGEVEQTERRYRELHGHAHGADEGEHPIGAVASDHDAPGGLWVTIRNRLPFERNAEEQVISQMHIHSACLTARRGEAYHEGGHRHGGACSGCAHDLRFRLSEQVDAQGQETFYLSPQHAAALYRQDAGQLTVEVRESAWVGGVNYRCRESIRIDDPASDPKQELTVEVQQRFSTDYGCSLALAPFRQQAE